MLSAVYLELNRQRNVIHLYITWEKIKLAELSSFQDVLEAWRKRFTSRCNWFVTEMTSPVPLFLATWFSPNDYVIRSMQNEGNLDIKLYNPFFLDITIQICS